MAKVSIIVPVYNAQKYLSQCLDSLLNQTLKETEIICVDDGSADDSVDIINQYSSKDRRVKLIRQKNSYAGVARNNGLKQAAGEYVVFVDADDFLKEICFAPCMRRPRKTMRRYVFARAGSLMRQPVNTKRQTIILT